MSDASISSILPAINRNFMNVITTNSSGIVAYGSRANIYFVDVRSNPPLVLDSKFIFNAHKGRIIGLSFTKSGEAEMLASISDDHQLKVWDTDTQECLYHSPIRESTRAVQWTYEPSPSLLYTLDPKYLLKFNFKQRSTSKIKLDLDIIVSAIVCHPKLHELAAVAHYNGTINVLNILQGEIRQTFKMHSKEITSLSWSPFSLLNLLSSSLDFTIRVWKVGEQKPVFTYHCPASRFRMDDKKKPRILAIFHPEKPSTFLFTSLRGEVLEMEYFDESKHQVSRFYMDNEFVKGPFSLFFVANSAERKNLLLCVDSFKIMLVDVNKQCALGQISFLGSFIYEIAFSPVTPSLMAICNGDGIMKVWNTQTKGSKIDVSSIFVFYKAKIFSAAWHPVEENILAFGTGEGRVGIIDFYKKKVLNHFETHHTDSVYSMCWAPCKKYNTENGKSDEGCENTMYLYSCGGGTIYIHKLSSFQDGTVNLNDLAQWPPDIPSTDNKGWSEIGWKPDYSVLCLGTFKGYMEIFNKEFVFLARINVPMKTVESLCWHPEKTYMSPNGSHLKTCFACSGNENDILIFDFSTIMKNVENGENQLHSEPFRKLTGHKKRVVSHCWSPHNDGFLASASKDSSALVWDVTSGAIIASFLNHRDIVLTVQWNPFDRDIVYSGGQDSCLRGWKMSELGVSSIPDKVCPKKKMRSIKFDPLAASVGLPPTDVEDKNLENGFTESKVQSSKSNENDAFSKGDGDSNKTSFSPKEHKTPVENGKTDHPDSLYSNSLSKISFDSKKSLFPELGYINSRYNVNDCARLADIIRTKNSTDDSNTLSNESESEKITDDDVNKFGPFLDQLTALRKLEIQGEQVKSKDSQSFLQLGIMAGNIEQTLQYCAEKGALSGFLVSLAPSVSYTFWLSMCEEYAKQLLAEKRYNAASSYYLACGKVHDAVNIFAGKGLLVDALVLARARLPSSDPLIRDITFKLVKKHGLLRNKIPEAECFLSVNEPLIAAKTLAAELSPNSARVATYICRKFNYDAEADDFALSCLEKCLMHCNASVFEQLLKDEPKMQIYEAFFQIYVAFHEQQLLYKSKTMYVESLFPHGSTDGVLVWKGATCTDAKMAFMEHMNNILSSVKNFSHEEMLAALKTFTEKRNISPANLQYISAVISITEFLHLCHLKEEDAALHKFQHMFHSIYDCKYLPKLVCFTLLPLSMEWNAVSGIMTCKSLVDENAKYDVSLYKNFLSCLIEKINSFQYQAVQSPTIIQEELELCIDYVTERISKILCKKNLEDCVLTYFSAFLLDSIEKAIKKVNEIPCLDQILKKEKPEEVSKNSQQNGQCPDGSDNQTDSGTMTVLQEKVMPLLADNSTAELNHPDSDDVKVDTSNLSTESASCIKDADTAANGEYSETLVPHSVTGVESQELIFDSSEKVNDISSKDQTEIHLSNGNDIESRLLEGSIEHSGDLIEQKDNVSLEDSVENKELGKLGKNSNANGPVTLSETGVADLIMETSSLLLRDCTDSESSKLENHLNGDMESATISNSVKNKLNDEEADNSKTDGSIEVDVEESPLSCNLHLKCFKNLDAFYTVLKFVTLNTCKDEYALLYYLKKHTDAIKSDLASKAVEEASKGPKNKQEGRKIQSNGLLENGLNELSEELESSKTIEKEPEQGSPNNLTTAADETVEAESSDQCSLNRTIDIQNPALGEVSEGSSDMLSDALEGTTENFKQSVEVESHFEKEMPAELIKLLDLVSILEKNQVYYPSPFDAVPKILVIMYHIMDVVKCHAVKNKLHEFIHDVISWSNKYSSVQKVLTCKNCQE